MLLQSACYVRNPSSVLKTKVQKWSIVASTCKARGRQRQHASVVRACWAVSPAFSVSGQCRSVRDPVSRPRWTLYEAWYLKSTHAQAFVHLNKHMHVRTQTHTMKDTNHSAKTTSTSKLKASRITREVLGCQFRKMIAFL